MMANVGDLGLPVSISFFASRTRQNAALLILGVRLGLLFTTIMFLGFAGLASTGAIAGLDATRPVLIYGACFFVTSYSTRLLSSLLRANSRFISFAFVRVTLAAAYVGVLIWLVASRDKFGVVDALVAGIIAESFALLVAATACAKVRIFTPFERNRIDSREVVKYGARAHLGNLSAIDGLRLDLAAISIFLSTTQIGLYAIAIAVSNIARSQAVAIGMAGMPAVASQTGWAAVSLGRKIVRRTIIVSLATSCLMAAVAPLLVPAVFGRSFDAAVPVTIALLGATAVACFRQALGDALRALERPGAGSIAELLTWAAALIAIPTLVPRLGLLGAPLAVGIAYTVGATWLWRAARQEGLVGKMPMQPGLSD